MRPLIVIGTRPEAIKLAPVARALPEADVILTGQHPVEMVVPTLEYFGVPTAHKVGHLAGLELDYSFGVIYNRMVATGKDASCIIAQGDTTTAAAAAMAAFYRGVPFVHVEAGLRTYNDTPYPEEFNRRLCALAATVNCAPTERAAQNLRSERVGGRIEVTGNTVVDAVRLVLDLSKTESPYRVLVSCHRRESRGRTLDMVWYDIGTIAWAHPGVRIAWSVHPSPHAKPKPIKNVDFIAPPNYPDWVHMMAAADLIITDSGGIQEEAAILRKPCLVLRNETEREEAVECGACRLVGCAPGDLFTEADSVLNGKPWPIRPHPFGDGHSGERIAKIVRKLTNTEHLSYESSEVPA